MYSSTSQMKGSGGPAESLGFKVVMLYLTFVLYNAT